MVKAHKRKNSGSIRRASRVYLTDADVGKVAALRASLLLYVNVVNYFIERFWTMKDFTPALADKVITGRAVNRFKKFDLLRIRVLAGSKRGAGLRQ
jgi:hypothetical protein